MSQVIDNRVVSMEFDNSKFEKNVQTSMQTLNNLNKTIDGLPNTAGKGLSNMSKTAGKIDLSGISSGIDAINSKFSALGIAGQEVIRSITRSAMQFGKNAWNMTFGQITSGGKRRSENIANARFTLEGMGLNFEDYKQDIDYAVDGTAYGFDQAAKAASVFASSGVKAGEDMKKALRGISGVAAMTNADFDEIAYVFEKVNGMGKVTGETLNMINGRGLNATAALAKYLNKTEEEVHKMVSKGQIGFAQFSDAMDSAFGEHAKDADKTFQGVSKNIRAQLSRIGQTFYDPLLENDSGLVKMLQSVKAKIKEVKEITDPFASTLANSILDLAGRAKILIDAFDVNKLKPAFEGMTKFIQSANVGLTFSNIISGIKSISKALEPLKKAAKDAFGEIFPKKLNAGTIIYDFSKKLARFGKYFSISSEAIDKFKRIFKGAFATVSLAGKILTSLKNSLSSTFEKFDGSGILEFFAKIGDFMVELNENYNIDKPFETLTQIFEKLKTVAGGLFGSIPEWINNFKGLIKTSDDTGNSFKKTTSIFDKFKQTIKDFIDKTIIPYKDKFVAFVTPIIAKIKELAAPIVAVLKPAIKSVINEIKALAGSDVYGGLVRLFTNSGIVAGAFALNLLTLIKRFKDSKKSMKSVVDTLSSFASGFKDFASTIKNLPQTVNTAISSTSKSLQKMLDKQGFEAQAKGILYLAVAVGILAASMLLLASIPQKKLFGALVAIETLSATIAGFLAAMSALESADDKIQTFKQSLSKLADSFKMSSMATSMVKMAAAVLILAFAMKQLQDLEWEDIGQGLTAITVLMAELFGMAVGLDKLDIGSFNKIAISFVILSAAIKILADSMVNMQGLNWTDVGQGLTAITVLMAELFGMAVGFDKLNIDSFMKIGVSMVILSKAIEILSNSMVAMKDLTWEDVGQGLTTLTVLLGELFILALGFQKMGIKSFLETAAGMTSIATGISAMAKAVQMLGNMDAQNLANGIAAITIMMAELAIVVFGLSKSQGFAKSAAGILAIGAAMILMAKAYETLGNMQPEQITQALMIFLTTIAFLAVVCALAQDSIVKAGLGMILIAVAMDVLTIAIKSLGKADLMQLIKGMVAVAAGLMVLVVALKFVEGSLAGAAALLIVSVGLVAFAAAMALLTVLPLADLAGTLLVVVVALAALAGVCYLMEGALLGAAAMLVVAASLLVLAVAVGMLAAIPFKAACEGLLALGIAILGFAGLSALLTPLLAPMAALAGILVLVSVGLLALGGGIALLGVGLQALAVYGAVGIASFGMFCEILAKNTKVLNKVAPAITVLGGALLILDAGLLVCSTSLMLMSVAMIAFGVAAMIFAASLVATVKIVKFAIKDFKEIFNHDEFKETGKNAVTGLGDGVKAGIGGVVDNIKAMGQAAIDKIKSFFGGGADSEMGKAGANGVKGFIAGIKSKFGEVGQMAKSLGSSFLSKLKGSLKIKSPSRETMKIGEYTGEGMAIGIKKSEKKVDAAAEDMGDSAVDAMSSALKLVNNAMNAEANPTITPELDLTNIQNGVDSMDSLLNNRQALNISANYNANKIAEQEQISFNQAQLASLGSQLNTLSGILANQPTPEVNANVILKGDADGVFKLVRDQDTIYTKMHGKSAFA